MRKEVSRLSLEDAVDMVLTIAENTYSLPQEISEMLKRKYMNHVDRDAICIITEPLGVYTPPTTESIVVTLKEGVTREVKLEARPENGSIPVRERGVTLVFTETGYYIFANIDNHSILMLSVHPPNHALVSTDGLRGAKIISAHLSFDGSPMFHGVGYAYTWISFEYIYHKVFSFGILDRAL